MKTKEKIGLTLCAIPLVTLCIVAGIVDGFLYTLLWIGCLGFLGLLVWLLFSD